MTRIIGAPEAKIDGWHVEIDASADLDQDQEFLHLTKAGQRRRVRFHDYGDLYDIPGLYDWVFYEALGCRAHEVVADSVTREVIATGLLERDQVRVLDLGAGNGIIARSLRDVGVEHLLGVDILDRARSAALRDSPEVYDGYLVADLGDPPPTADQTLREFAPNVLVSAAALGYGDIPPQSFVNAVGYLSPPAAVVFTVKQKFLTNTVGGGYAEVLSGQHPKLEVLDRRPFVHRASSTGHELVYECVVARRLDEAPEREGR